MLISSPQEFEQWLQERFAARDLREERLREVQEFVLRNQARVAWLGDYMWLAFMPRFLNVAVVDGACNCDCRMCSAGKGMPFRYLKSEQLRTILRHVPTASRLSFSAGNSEPLLNPEFGAIIEAGAEAGCQMDFYTNGLALKPALTRLIVESGAVNMINFSLDAATGQTYRAIRRRDLSRVHRAIAGLVDQKKEQGKELPHISVSLVEMEDNIGELPDLVDYAASVGAFRVYVEALIKPDEVNHSSLDHPGWREFVREAHARAARHGITLQLPSKLQRTMLPGQSPDVSTEQVKAGEGKDPAFVHAHCAWLPGAWINLDGAISPCCLVHNVPMGNIYDGPLRGNMPYLVQKMKLFAGRVFPACRHHVENCLFLAERKGNAIVQD